MVRQAPLTILDLKTWTAFGESVKINTILKVTEIGEPNGVLRDI
jgi:hypothetical protein